MDLYQLRETTRKHIKSSVSNPHNVYVLFGTKSTTSLANGKMNTRGVFVCFTLCGKLGTIFEASTVMLNHLMATKLNV